MVFRAFTGTALPTSSATSQQRILDGVFNDALDRLLLEATKHCYAHTGPLKDQSQWMLRLRDAVQLTRNRTTACPPVDIFYTFVLAAEVLHHMAYYDYGRAPARRIYGTTHHGGSSAAGMGSAAQQQQQAAASSLESSGKKILLPVHSTINTFRSLLIQSISNVGKLLSLRLVPMTPEIIHLTCEFIKSLAFTFGCERGEAELFLEEPAEKDPVYAEAAASYTRWCGCPPPFATSPSSAHTRPRYTLHLTADPPLLVALLQLLSTVAASAAPSSSTAKGHSSSASANVSHTVAGGAASVGASEAVNAHSSAPIRHVWWTCLLLWQHLVPPDSTERMEDQRNWDAYLHLLPTNEKHEEELCSHLRNTRSPTMFHPEATASSSVMGNDDRVSHTLSGGYTKHSGLVGADQRPSAAPASIPLNTNLTTSSSSSLMLATEDSSDNAAPSHCLYGREMCAAIVAEGIMDCVRLLAQADDQSNESDQSTGGKGKVPSGGTGLGIRSLSEIRHALLFLKDVCAVIRGVAPRSWSTDPNFPYSSFSNQNATTCGVVFHAYPYAYTTWWLPPSILQGAAPLPISSLLSSLPSLRRMQERIRQVMQRSQAPLCIRPTPLKASGPFRNINGNSVRMPQTSSPVSDCCRCSVGVGLHAPPSPDATGIDSLNVTLSSGNALFHSFPCHLLNTPTRHSAAGVEMDSMGSLEINHHPKIDHNGSAEGGDSALCQHLPPFGLDHLDPSVTPPQLAGELPRSATVSNSIPSPLLPANNTEPPTPTMLKMSRTTNSSSVSLSNPGAFTHSQSGTAFGVPSVSPQSAALAQLLVETLLDLHTLPLPGNLDDKVEAEEGNPLKSAETGSDSGEMQREDTAVWDSLSSGKREEDATHGHRYPKPVIPLHLYRSSMRRVLLEALEASLEDPVVCKRSCAANSVKAVPLSSSSSVGVGFLLGQFLSEDVLRLAMSMSTTPVEEDLLATWSEEDSGAISSSSLAYHEFGWDPFSALRSASVHPATTSRLRFKLPSACYYHPYLFERIQKMALRALSRFYPLTGKALHALLYYHLNLSASLLHTASSSSHTTEFSAGYTPSGTFPEGSVNHGHGFFTTTENNDVRPTASMLLFPPSLIGSKWGRPDVPNKSNGAMEPEQSESQRVLIFLMALWDMELFRSPSLVASLLAVQAKSVAMPSTLSFSSAVLRGHEVEGNHDEESGMGGTAGSHPSHPRDSNASTSATADAHQWDGDRGLSCTGYMCFPFFQFSKHPRLFPVYLALCQEQGYSPATGQNTPHSSLNRPSNTTSRSTVRGQLQTFREDLIQQGHRLPGVVQQRVEWQLPLLAAMTLVCTAVATRAHLQSGRLATASSRPHPPQHEGGGRGRLYSSLHGWSEGEGEAEELQGSRKPPPAALAALHSLSQSLEALVLPESSATSSAPSIFSTQAEWWMPAMQSVFRVVLPFVRAALPLAEDEATTEMLRRSQLLVPPSSSRRAERSSATGRTEVLQNRREDTFSTEAHTSAAAGNASVVSNSPCALLVELVVKLNLHYAQLAAAVLRKVTHHPTLGADLSSIAMLTQCYELCLHLLAEPLKSERISCTFLPSSESHRSDCGSARSFCFTRPEERTATSSMVDKDTVVVNVALFNVLKDMGVPGVVVRPTATGSGGGSRHRSRPSVPPDVAVGTDAGTARDPQTVSGQRMLVTLHASRSAQACPREDGEDASLEENDGGGAGVKNKEKEIRNTAADLLEEGTSLQETTAEHHSGRSRRRVARGHEHGQPPSSGVFSYGSSTRSDSSRSSDSYSSEEGDFLTKSSSALSRSRMSHPSSTSGQGRTATRSGSPSPQGHEQEKALYGDPSTALEEKLGPQASLPSKVSKFLNHLRAGIGQQGGHVSPGRTAAPAIASGEEQPHRSRKSSSGSTTAIPAALLAAASAQHTQLLLRGLQHTHHELLLLETLLEMVWVRITPLNDAQTSVACPPTSSSTATSPLTSYVVEVVTLVLQKLDALLARGVLLCAALQRLTGLLLSAEETSLHKAASASQQQTAAVLMQPSKSPNNLHPQRAGGFPFNDEGSTAGGSRQAHHVRHLREEQARVQLYFEHLYRRTNHIQYLVWWVCLTFTQQFSISNPAIRPPSSSAPVEVTAEMYIAHEQHYAHFLQQMTFALFQPPVLPSQLLEKEAKSAPQSVGVSVRRPSTVAEDGNASQVLDDNDDGDVYSEAPLGGGIPFTERTKGCASPSRNSSSSTRPVQICDVNSPRGSPLSAIRVSADSAAETEDGAKMAPDATDRGRATPATASPSSSSPYVRLSLPTLSRLSTWQRWNELLLLMALAQVQQLLLHYWALTSSGGCAASSIDIHPKEQEVQHLSRMLRVTFDAVETLQRAVFHPHIMYSLATELDSLDEPSVSSDRDGPSASKPRAELNLNRDMEEEAEVLSAAVSSVEDEEEDRGLSEEETLFVKEVEATRTPRQIRRVTQHTPPFAPMTNTFQQYAANEKQRQRLQQQQQQDATSFTGPAARPYRYSHHSSSLPYQSLSPSLSPQEELDAVVQLTVKRACAVVLVSPLLSHTQALVFVPTTMPPCPLPPNPTLWHSGSQKRSSAASNMTNSSSSSEETKRGEHLAAVPPYHDAYHSDGLHSGDLRLPGIPELATLCRTRHHVRRGTELRLMEFLDATGIAGILHTCWCRTAPLATGFQSPSAFFTRQRPSLVLTEVLALAQSRFAVLAEVFLVPTPPLSLLRAASPPPSQEGCYPGVPLLNCASGTLDVGDESSVGPGGGGELLHSLLVSSRLHRTQRLTLCQLQQVEVLSRVLSHIPATGWGCQHCFRSTPIMLARRHALSTMLNASMPSLLTSATTSSSPSPVVVLANRLAALMHRNEEVVETVFMLDERSPICCSCAVAVERCRRRQLSKWRRSARRAAEDVTSRHALPSEREGTMEEVLQQQKHWWRSVKRHRQKTRAHGMGALASVLRTQLHHQLLAQFHANGETLEEPEVWLEWLRALRRTLDISLSGEEADVCVPTAVNTADAQRWKSAEEGENSYHSLNVEHATTCTTNLHSAVTVLLHRGASLPSPHSNVASQQLPTPRLPVWKLVERSFRAVEFVQQNCMAHLHKSPQVMEELVRCQGTLVRYQGSTSYVFGVASTSLDEDPYITPATPLPLYVLETSESALLETSADRGESVHHLSPAASNGSNSVGSSLLALIRSAAVQTSGGGGVVAGGSSFSQPQRLHLNLSSIQMMWSTADHLSSLFPSDEASSASDLYYGRGGAKGDDDAVRLSESLEDVGSVGTRTPQRYKSKGWNAQDLLRLWALLLQELYDASQRDPRREVRQSAMSSLFSLWRVYGSSSTGGDHTAKHIEGSPLSHLQQKVQRMVWHAALQGGSGPRPPLPSQWQTRSSFSLWSWMWSSVTATPFVMLYAMQKLFVVYHESISVRIRVEEKAEEEEGADPNLERRARRVMQCREETSFLGLLPLYRSTNPRENRQSHFQSRSERYALHPNLLMAVSQTEVEVWHAVLPVTAQLVRSRRACNTEARQHSPPGSQGVREAPLLPVVLQQYLQAWNTPSAGWTGNLSSATGTAAFLSSSSGVSAAGYSRIATPYQHYRYRCLSYLGTLIPSMRIAPTSSSLAAIWLTYWASGTSQSVMLDQVKVELLDSVSRLILESYHEDVQSEVERGEDDLSSTTHLTERDSAVMCFIHFCKAMLCVTPSEVTLMKRESEGKKKTFRPTGGKRREEQVSLAAARALHLLLTQLRPSPTLCDAMLSIMLESAQQVSAWRLESQQQASRSSNPHGAPAVTTASTTSPSSTLGFQEVLLEDRLSVEVCAELISAAFDFFLNATSPPSYSNSKSISFRVLHISDSFPTLLRELVFPLWTAPALCNAYFSPTPFHCALLDRLWTWLFPWHSKREMSVSHQRHPSGSVNLHENETRIPDDKVIVPVALRSLFQDLVLKCVLPHHWYRDHLAPLLAQTFSAIASSPSTAAKSRPFKDFLPPWSHFPTLSGVLVLLRAALCLPPSPESSSLQENSYWKPPHPKGTASSRRRVSGEERTSEEVNHEGVETESLDMLRLVRGVPSAGWDGASDHVLWLFLHEQDKSGEAIKEKGETERVFYQRGLTCLYVLLREVPGVLEGVGQLLPLATLRACEPSSRTDVNPVPITNFPEPIFFTAVTALLRDGLLQLLLTSQGLCSIEDRTEEEWQQHAAFRAQLMELWPPAIHAVQLNLCQVLEMLPHSFSAAAAKSTTQSSLALHSTVQVVLKALLGDATRIFQIWSHIDTRARQESKTVAHRVDTSLRTMAHSVWQSLTLAASLVPPLQAQMQTLTSGLRQAMEQAGLLKEVLTAAAVPPAEVSFSDGPQNRSPTDERSEASAPLETVAQECHHVGCGSLDNTVESVLTRINTPSRLSPQLDDGRSGVGGSQDPTATALQRYAAAEKDRVSSVEERRQSALDSLHQLEKQYHTGGQPQPQPADGVAVTDREGIRRVLPDLLSCVHVVDETTSEGTSGDSEQAFRSKLEDVLRLALQRLGVLSNTTTSNTLDPLTP